MGNTAINVNLTVEMDLDDWRLEYAMQESPQSVVRADIRRAAQLVVEDWLRTVGFKGASVRVNTATRFAGLRS